MNFNTFIEKGWKFCHPTTKTRTRTPTPTPPGSLCPHGGDPLLIYYFLSLPVLLLLSYSLQKPC